MLSFDDAWSFETTKINHSSVTAPSSPVFLGDDIAPSFETPPKKNQGATAPSAHIFKGSDSLKSQHKNRTHRPGQKLPPPRKQYLFFQMSGKTAHTAQC